MSRRAGLAILVGSAVLAVGLAAWALIHAGASRQKAEGQTESPVSADEPAAAREPWRVELYFPGADGRLTPERRDLPRTDGGIEERAAALVAAVLEGPRAEDLVAPLPDDTELAGVFVTRDGTVYVDFRSAEGEQLPPTGSQRELQMLYSLVDSVLLNLPEAERMAILWNGRQPPTFAGHVDISRPLRARTDLIARRGS